MDEKIQKVAELLRNAKRVLFITGAGISADSGLPTYRGIGGLYNDNETEDDVPIEIALSGPMLKEKPEVTWKHLFEIAEACSDAGYNKGHEIIARIEKEIPGTWVLTQNVDGFHHDAGSKNLIEIHGRFSDLYCIECSYTCHTKEIRELEKPFPRCPKCGALVRPAVILFAEALPSEEVATLSRELSIGFDLVFTIGTSSLFPYITQPVVNAKYQGIPTVEINPGETEVSEIVTHKISGGAADSLAKIWECYSALK